MSEYMQSNDSFASFEGYIARRDFAVNILYICMMSMVLYSFQINNNESIFRTIVNLFNLQILDYIPIINTIIVIVFAYNMYALISNITRRINDITGKFDYTKNLIACIFTFLVYINIIIKNPTGDIILPAGFFLSIYLCIKEGKISGEKPYDIKQDFNWGAFFGTFLWGLFNKSFQTLWMIPLNFTPLAFCFQLICGFKGNEWAFEKFPSQDIKAFQDLQAKQTIIFIILMTIILPVIFGILGIALALFINSNDAFKDLFIQELINFLEKTNLLQYFI